MALFKKSRTRGGKATLGQTWIARFRDHDGKIREVNTRCREQRSAERVLEALEARVEKVAAGILSASDIQAADWAAVPLNKHLDAFIGHLEKKGYTENHVFTRRHYCTRAIVECKFHRLGDISRARFESWLLGLKDSGLSARTANMAKAAMVQFARWAIRDGRLTSNPIEGTEGFSEAVDRRHIRRALSPEELHRLTESTRTRHNQRTSAKVQGAGRALAYELMAGTGIRYGELRRLRVADIFLDGGNPRIEIPAAATKNRKPAAIPLRRDLAQSLSQYLAEKSEAEHAATVVPFKANPSALLFAGLPDKITHTFDRDLKAAGIEKHDTRGRVVDAHSLRVTFITQLAASGVPLATAQVLARHSDPRLTANVYTDPALLDLRGAVEGVSVHVPEQTRIAAQVSGEKWPRNGPRLEGKTVHFTAVSGSSEDSILEGECTISREHPDTEKSAKKPHLLGVCCNTGVVNYDSKEWRARQDSNLWPLAPEARGLKSESLEPQEDTAHSKQYGHEKGHAFNSEISQTDTNSESVNVEQIAAQLKTNPEAMARLLAELLKRAD